MDAREELLRFGRVSLDPNKHVRDERAFWANVRKQMRTMRHRDIREEEEVKRLLSQPAPPRRRKRRGPYILKVAKWIGIFLVLFWCLTLVLRSGVIR